MEVNKDMLKLAASCLDELLQRNEELEALVKKSELVEEIAQKLIDQQIITTLDNYHTKVAELEEKPVQELESLKTFLDVYAPQVKLEFGKLAETSFANLIGNLSAEEQFTNILIGGKN